LPLTLKLACDRQGSADFQQLLALELGQKVTENLFISLLGQPF
jgi:hypothetical protein